jgi:2-polyprenyl-3-methyl-5-hydroxy-6-metoxy-1,4-benzoquinol methylase
MNSYRAKIYSKYNETFYSHLNKCGESAYRQTSKTLRRLYKKFLPENRSAQILDIGCGTGYFLYALKTMGYTNVEGIDISEQQVTIAKSLGLNVTQSDIFEFLRDKNQQYDVIIATDLLEHLTKNEIIELLDSANKAMRPEGIFMCAVPNASSPFASRCRYIDFTHETGFTEETFKEIFEVTNFKVSHIMGEKVRPRTIKAVIRYVMSGCFKFVWKLFMIAELGSQAGGTPLDYKLICIAQKSVD